MDGVCVGGGGDGGVEEGRGKWKGRTTRKERMTTGEYQKEKWKRGKVG